jgi:hypothetical protein
VESGERTVAGSAVMFEKLGLESMFQPCGRTKEEEIIGAYALFSSLSPRCSIRLREAWESFQDVT